MEISAGINPEFRTTAERRGIKLIKKWPYKGDSRGSALHRSSFANQVSHPQVPFVRGQNRKELEPGMGRAGGRGG